MVVVWIQIFKAKKWQRKSTMQVFISNNARFRCQSKEKVLTSNTFRGMEIWTIIYKNGKPY